MHTHIRTTANSKSSQHLIKRYSNTKSRHCYTSEECKQRKNREEENNKPTERLFTTAIKTSNEARLEQSNLELSSVTNYTHSRRRDDCFLKNKHTNIFKFIMLRWSCGSHIVFDNSSLVVLLVVLLLVLSVSLSHSSRFSTKPLMFHLFG